MCGIFGYVGKKDAGSIILKGLKRLEYRGYDSWGITVVKNGGLKSAKAVGSIERVDDIVEIKGANSGIGHTRWATHGRVSKKNAHPHFANGKEFALAQNGIVENYQQLKDQLSKYNFNTETDTEVIVRLVEDNLQNSATLLDAARKAFLELDGRNTIILISKNGEQVVAIRNGSPLIVGVGKGELYYSSDVVSLGGSVDKVMTMNNFEAVEYRDGKLKVVDVRNGKEIDKKETSIKGLNLFVDKEGYKHFLLKEIVDQRHAVKQAVSYSRQDLNDLGKCMKSARRIYTVGAGTASYAAGQIAYFLRKVGCDALELKAYEVDSYMDAITHDDLVIGVSQSGETADTIEALESAKDKGAKLASLVNMVGSTITRMSDYPLLLRSGPEISVVSTKAFSAQISLGYLVAQTLVGRFRQAKQRVHETSQAIERLTNKSNREMLKSIAKELAEVDDMFILGKAGNYYAALEGALKLKETVYTHAEGFSAGELKHGVIALIEKQTPVFVIVPEDELRADILSAASEVKARGARVFGLSNDPNEIFDTWIKVPSIVDMEVILNVVPFQLLAYYLALERGYDPDRPRNLAKSVTVK